MVAKAQVSASTGGTSRRKKEAERAVTYSSAHDELKTQLEPDPDYLTLNLLFFSTSDSESSLPSPQGWWGTNGADSWFSELKV